MIDPKRIWSSSQLPTLPGVAVRLLELTKDPETELRQVIEVISADPAISAKIMKAANSSFFGLTSEVRTIERAVPLLGTTVSTSMALSFSLADDAMTRGPVAEHYLSYWRQSIVQACAGELLAHRFNRALGGEFFLCGLLLDLGRLAMLKTIARQYVPVLEAWKGSLTPLIDCETESLGFSHVEIGTKLMENWKLPKLMVQAVQLHHARLASLSELRDEPHYLLIAAMATAATVGDYLCTPLKNQAFERLRILAEEHWQMSPAQLEDFLRGVEERFKQAGNLFKVDMTEIGNSSDLILDANEQLAQIALKEHLASTQAAVRQQSAEAEMRVLESKNVALQQQALHDPLTRLYNRHFFDEMLEKEYCRAIRTASPVGVLFADVDHFKKLNDTYGHQAGDEVLRRVAALFTETARDSDIIARFGGEEFVVLVGQPTEKGLEKLATRIRERVANHEFEFQDMRMRVTVSLGAAVVIPGRQPNRTCKDLVAAADACLYESKQAGRNRVTVRSLINDDERRLITLVAQQRFSRWLVSRGLLDIPTISRALIDEQSQSLPIGELAVQKSLLTCEQVEAILAEQRHCADRFGEIACRKRWLTYQQLALLLAWQLEDPHQLAGAMIRLGILSPTAAADALEDYTQSSFHTPRRPAVVGTTC